MKTITFIINPISGTTHKNYIPQLINEIINSSLFQIEVIYTEYAGHAHALAKQKAQDKVDIVVAVGGDGTVNEVASALVHTTTSLAIVPCGSGNGLARHLQIPLNIQEAVSLITKGVSRKIDYGKINKKLFFCSCGVGFDALVSWRFSQAPRRGFMTYCNIAIKENFNYKPELYQLKVDNNQTITKRAFVIACGNSSEYGNDAYIAPKASIQDGLLDITLIEPITLLDIPVLSYQLFNKTIDENKKTSTFRCKTLHIERKSKGPIHFDGEPIIAPKELIIEVVPSGLNVITFDNLSI